MQFVIRACDLHGPAGLTLALLDRAQQRAWSRGVDRPARVVSGPRGRRRHVGPHRHAQRDPARRPRGGRLLVGPPARRPRRLDEHGGDAARRSPRTSSSGSSSGGVTTVTAGRATVRRRCATTSPSSSSPGAPRWSSPRCRSPTAVRSRGPRRSTPATRSGLIGYDAIPFVSADLRPFGEPNAFAQYLTVVEHADRVAGISTSAVEEFAGFVDALASQGVTGPVVTEVVQPVTVPAGAGRLRPGRARGAARRLRRSAGAAQEPRHLPPRSGAAVARGPALRPPHRRRARLDHRPRRAAALRAAPPGATVTWMRGVGDDELWQLIRG